MSSLLLRALATAHVIAEAIDLREGSGDTYCGISSDVIEARFPRALVPARMPTDGWLYVAETDVSFAARCQRLVDECHVRSASDDHVLVVTHGGVANHLLHALLHMPLRTPVWFDLAHCGLTTVRLVPEHEREG